MKRSSRLNTLAAVIRVAVGFGTLAAASDSRGQSAPAPAASPKPAVEDKEAQFVQTFENLRKVLQAAGASFDDIVDVTSFHTDMRDLPLYMKVRDRYFTANFPAWTAIGAAQLCGQPGYFLEVKAIAVLPDRHAS